MQIREEFLVFENTNTPLEYTIDTLSSDLLKIQVIGTGKCLIEVSAKLTNSDDYSIVAIIDDKTYDMLNSIEKSGLYSVPVTGYKKVKICVKSVVETLRCTAAEVDE